MAYTTEWTKAIRSSSCCLPPPPGAAASCLQEAVDKAGYCIQDWSWQEVECDELHGQRTCVKDVMARCPDAKWDPWVNLYLDIIEDMMDEGECGVDLTLSGIPPGSPPTRTSSTPTSEALFNSTDDPVVSIRFMASPLPTPSTECSHSELQPNISTQSDSLGLVVHTSLRLVCVVLLMALTVL